MYLIVNRLVLWEYWRYFGLFFFVVRKCRYWGGFETCSWHTSWELFIRDEGLFLLLFIIFISFLNFLHVFGIILNLFGFLLKTGIMCQWERIFRVFLFSVLMEVVVDVVVFVLEDILIIGQIEVIMFFSYHNFLQLCSFMDSPMVLCHLIWYRNYWI
jgi:hypothetical protein